MNAGYWHLIIRTQQNAAACKLNSFNYKRGALRESQRESERGQRDNLILREAIR